MDNANIAVIKESIQALQALVYWHESGTENPGHQTDAAIDAQREIDDLIQSDAIRTLRRAALVRRKAEFAAKLKED